MSGDQADMKGPCAGGPGRLREWGMRSDERPQISR